MNRKPVLGVVAVVVAGIGWVLFMSRGDQVSVTTPEATVEAIYERCQARMYDATAAFYLGGPADDGEMRVTVCEKITQSRTVKGWEIVSNAATGADAVIITRNLREGEDGRILKWTLTRKGGGWLVAEVV